MAQRGRRPATGAGPATRPATRPEGRSGPDPAANGRGELAVLRTRLRSVVEPLLHHSGFDLEDLSVSRVGRRHVVRVTIDADGGVGHDELSDLSREISAGLDAAESGRDGQPGGELIAGSYTLEVSSPGVDRPLTLPRHWRRNVGRLVRFSAGGTTVTARVTAADDAGVTFTVDGQTRTAAYPDLGPGRVQVEFARAGEDGDEDADWEPTGEEDGS